MTTCCFKGRGKIWLRKQITGCGTNPNPWFHIGNASLFQINNTTTESTVKDYTSKIGGIACSSVEIDQVNLNMTINCLNARNFALALNAEGDIGNIPAGTITDEGYTVIEEGEFIPASFMPTDDVNLVVTGPAGVPVYVKDTDYRVTGNGIELIKIADGGSIGVGQVLEIDFNYVQQTLLDLIQAASVEYEVFLDGFNIGAAIPEPFGVNLFRVRFGPASNVGFISDDFAVLEVTGKVMQDECHINANGFEQYGIYRELA